MSAVITQELSSGEFCKLRYDTIPQLKNAKFWVVTLLSQISDIYIYITDYIYFKTELSARLWATKAIYIVLAARYDWIYINRFFSKHNTKSCM